MANLLDRFNIKVVGSDNKIADFTSTISSQGDFTRIEDLNVILNSWNNVLVTPRRSYLNDPEYGSDLYKYIFEPIDEITVNKIKEEINYRLMLYDDRATIEEIEISILSDNKGFNILLFVDYQGAKGELTISINSSLYDTFTT